MVKAKKMSNDIKKYIKYVKKIIPIHSKDKKEFIQLLTQKIIEFSNEHDSCSYQDIVDEFGSPNEVAGSYIETLDSDEIIKKLNKKKIINIFISVIIILCISVWGFERYRINQLIDEAKHTKMKTYTAEEYKEKIAKLPQEDGYKQIGILSKKNTAPKVKSGFTIENLQKFKEMATFIPKTDIYIIGSLREINIKEINNDIFEIELIYDDNENDDI